MAKMLVRGDRVGDYTVSRWVAGGGEANVYEARAADKSKVALRQHRFSISDPGSARDVERLTRLGTLARREFPHAAQILEIFVQDDTPYMAMEWVDGETLQSLIDRKTEIGLREWLPLAHGVLASLDWLHGQGVVHRDVKPANVMVLSKAGRPVRAKLLDYGIALHRHEPRLTHKSGINATLDYAPPEMLLGGESDIDERADVYCFGVTTFQVVTGRLPFEGLTHPLSGTALTRFLSPDRPSMRDLVPRISPNLDEYVQRLLAPKRDDRPCSARQAWQELADIVANEKRLVVPSLDEIWPASTSARKPSTLRIGSGPLLGTHIDIPKVGITLGRDAINQDDELISRFHVRVLAKRNGFHFRDLGSTNGLISKGRRLRRVVLRPGEEITIGATPLECV